MIEGQVVRMGGALRVTADLVDGESGYVAWSKGFDAPPQEALRLVEQLAPEIATNLATTLSPEQRAQLAERPTQNGAAYEAYVKGLRIFDQLDNPQAPGPGPRPAEPRGRARSPVRTGAGSVERDAVVSLCSGSGSTPPRRG